MKPVTFIACSMVLLELGGCESLMALVDVVTVLGMRANSY